MPHIRQEMLEQDGQSPVAVALGKLVSEVTAAISQSQEAECHTQILSAAHRFLLANETPTETFLRILRQVRHSLRSSIQGIES